MKQYAGKPFELVGVNLDQNEIDGLNCQLGYQLTWRSFYDGQHSIADAYGIFSIPTIMIIDSQGKIQWIGHQFNDELVAKLVADAE